MQPTVVITGSEGLIGEALIRTFHGTYNVVGLDIRHSPDLDGLRDPIQCDLTSDEGADAAFKRLEERHGPHIASFVHLAAYYDFSGEDSPLYEKLNVEGTGRVLKRLQGFETEQFVFSSTLLVMKPSDGGAPLDESSPLQAEWLYPQSKVRAERAIARERGSIPAVVLRIAGVYDDLGHAVPVVQQVRRIYEKQLQSYFFPGDDSHGQSVVHLDDLVDAIERTIERRHELGGLETFLIGEAEVMSYAALQDEIGELLHGKEWPSIRIPAPVAKLGARAIETLGSEEGAFIKPWMIDLADQDYRIDITKARDKLGWNPHHTLRETLPRITGSLLEDPERWYRENGLEFPGEQKDREKRTA